MGEQTDRLLLDVEFTRRWYREFIERLQADGYTFRGFGDRMEDTDILLRHDVDLSLASALRTAELEASLGVHSTYCVLLGSGLYNPLSRQNRERLDRIDSLGHDVALHFSTHKYWDEQPDPGAVEARVADELAVLESGLGISTETVSFHIPPEWVLGRTFSGFHSTYEPAYYENIAYVADSGQRWRDEPPRLHDRDGAVQILTHPGLWRADDADFDERVEHAVVDACRETRRHARQEFIEGVYD